MSKVSNILENIVTTIQSINGPSTYTNTIANSFNGDISQVEPMMRPFGEIPEDQFPHFNVIYKEENRIKEPSHWRSLLSTEICVIFNNSSETEIANWIADLEIALSQDIRRGNQTFVHDSWIEKITRDDGTFKDGLANPAYRIIRVEFLILYTYQFGQP